METIDWRNSCYSHAKLTANVLKMICNCLKEAVLTTESWHMLTMNKLNEIILCFSPKNLSFVDLEEAVNKVYYYLDLGRIVNKVALISV